MAPVTFPEATRPGRADSSGASGDAATRAARRDSELARVRFRRALVLLLMRWVLPGSGQLVLGE